MDPIPEKLKNLKTCHTDGENGRVYKDLSQMSSVIIFALDKTTKTGEFHPLCCYAKTKFNHNSAR